MHTFLLSGDGSHMTNWSENRIPKLAYSKKHEALKNFHPVPNQFNQSILCDITQRNSVPSRNKKAQRESTKRTVESN